MGVVLASPLGRRKRTRRRQWEELPAYPQGPWEEDARCETRCSTNTPSLETGEVTRLHSRPIDFEWLERWEAKKERGAALPDSAPHRAWEQGSTKTITL